jgi:hypothetical protein
MPSQHETDLTLPPLGSSIVAVTKPHLAIGDDVDAGFGLALHRLGHRGF